MNKQSDSRDRTQPVVEAHGVRKVYRPFPRWLSALIRSPVRREVLALDSMDLRLDPGEICAVVGPNGAGKTTFFRILVGLMTPDSGEVRVAGRDPTTDGRFVRAHVGWMPSETRTLFMRQTCAENLWFHGRLQAMGRRELKSAIPQMLERVGLGHAVDDVVFSLSSGMRQRLLLARALLHRPDLLLLDEPTGSIDPVAAYSLLELVREIVAEQGLAALISSHRLEEIEALGSRLVLLDDGHKRFEGNLDELRDVFRGSWLQLTFASPEAAQEAAASLSPRDLTVENGTVRVAIHGESTGEMIRALGERLDELRDVSVKQTPLRELLGQVYEATG